MKKKKEVLQEIRKSITKKENLPLDQDLIPQEKEEQKEKVHQGLIQEGDLENIIIREAEVEVHHQEKKEQEIEGKEIKKKENYHLN